MHANATRAMIASAAPGCLSSHSSSLFCRTLTCDLLLVGHPALPGLSGALFFLMAPAAGLEPATSRLGGGRSVHLSYAGSFPGSRAHRATVSEAQGVGYGGPLHAALTAA